MGCYMMKLALVSLFTLFATLGSAFADDLPGCDPQVGKGMAFKRVANYASGGTDRQVSDVRVSFSRVMRYSQFLLYVTYSYDSRELMEPWEGDDMHTVRRQGFMVLDAKCKIIHDDDGNGSPITSGN